MYSNQQINLRDLSCLLRCSLLLNARLQNWHLYFFSGVAVDFLVGVAPVTDAAAVAVAVAGILPLQFECRLEIEAQWWRAGGME